MKPRREAIVGRSARRTSGALLDAYAHPRLLLVFLGLSIGLMLLAGLNLLPLPFGTLALNDATSRAGALEYLRQVVGAGLLLVVLFALLAAVATAMPRKHHGWKWWCTAPVVALLLAALVAWLAVLVRERQWPESAQLAAPLLGILLGGTVVTLWRAGAWGRRLVVPLVLLVFIVPLILVRLGVSSAPLSFAPEQVTSEEKRRLVGLVRRAPTPWGQDYEVRELSLSTRDINLLAHWALIALEGEGTSSKVDVALAGPGWQCQGVLRLPGAPARYLNVWAQGTAGVRDGTPSLTIQQLEMGRLRCPWPLTLAIGPLLESYVRSEPELARLVSCVEQAHLTPNQVTAVVHKGRLTRDVLPQLEFVDAPVIEATLAQLEYLQPRMAQLLRSPNSFERIHEAAFSLAVARSGNSSAVTENRAALLALGILLGHPKLGKLLLGERFTPAAYQAAAVNVGRSPLRARRDWTRHYAVGAALAVQASPAISEAVGLLKEELDAAEGGSGFSFSDLAADMAGTRLAYNATRDEHTAIAMQLALSHKCTVDQIFPPVADLPEGISADQLEYDYGGIGGEEYQKMVAEIRRRIGTCRFLSSPPDDASVQP